MITNTLIALLISSRALRKKLYQCTPHMHASLLVLVSSFIAVSDLILKLLRLMQSKLRFIQIILLSNSSPIQPFRVKIKAYATKITLQQTPYPTSYIQWYGILSHPLSPSNTGSHVIHPICYLRQRICWRKIQGGIFCQDAPLW